MAKTKLVVIHILLLRVQFVVKLCTVTHAHWLAAELEAADFMI